MTSRALRILLTSRADGGAVLRCERADGSVTWQRHEGRNAQFFPLHDLTHYAAETTLGARRGFFGLVADGWDIADTGGKGARGPLPAQALLVEHLVGFLDAERASGSRWTAADFQAQASQVVAEHGESVGTVPTDEMLASIRARRAELFARWAALEVGGTLELTFDPDAP